MNPTPPKVFNYPLSTIHYPLLWLLLSTVCFGSCGKRRPPLPPIEQVPQRTELLTGVQQGNTIILTWPLSARNAEDSSVQSVRRIDIYRLTEPLAAPLGLTEEEFARQATVIGSVDVPQSDSVSSTLSYVDGLQQNLPVPSRLRYALRYVNAANQRASFSNFLLLEPSLNVSAPPLLSEPEETEKSIVLRWQPPSANVDGTTPVNLLGYNVYRQPKSQPENERVRLNQAQAVTVNRFDDTDFSFNQDYVYVVRALSLGRQGQAIESADSNFVAAAPRDIYRPSSPTKLTIAPPAPNRLSLFFLANPEPDVAGYNIYRSTDSHLPKDQWLKLNETLYTRTTFTDNKVQNNTRYYYYVIAIDQAGNLSQPSEVVSEVSQ